MLCLNLFEGRSLAISDLHKSIYLGIFLSYFCKKITYKRKRLRPSKIKMKSAVLGLLREIADTKKEEVKLPLIFIGCGGRIWTDDLQVMSLAITVLLENFKMLYFVKNWLFFNNFFLKNFLTSFTELDKICSNLRHQCGTENVS